MFSRIIKPKSKKPSKQDTGDGGSDAATSSSSMSKSAGNASKVLTGGNGTRTSNPNQLAYTAAPPAAVGSVPAPKFFPARDRTSAIEGPYVNGTDPLPLLRDVSSADRPNLFLRKVNLCCVLFDFTQASKNSREKEIKRQTLSELADYVSTGTSKLTEIMTTETFRMIRINIFRALPTTHDDSIASDGLDAEEAEPIYEPAWPHLQLVYELLMSYVNSGETDPKIARHYIDHSFLLMLLELFDSEDPRERDSLKTIMHRIYGKFMVHRPFIRKGINNVFYRFIFETEKHNGIAELLEILGSIINGFALPLKEEHKLFLVRALIPLHKPKCLPMYQQQLTYCITQFVEKDFKLADTVIKGLLKCWPLTNSQKEVILLGEVEEVLELTQPTEFQRCMVPFFKQLARCLNSSHFQVAERALFMWNNTHIINLIAQNRHVILPLVFNALEKNTSSHWNPSVNGLTTNVRKLFRDMDEELFQECLKKYKEDEEKAKAMDERRESIWVRLEMLADSRETKNS
ncbi:hypothetical protein KP509_17G047800 [Ceratopteris richardii]|uniref:Serine/threonine protein phosphatase 2A regulatory subunit n=1 Tax=Ceratopteris richardii TaxID=49495 RepID=A0A8T2SU20_CERRI|nr:hypothetical protein KP509_17G047800 [Ceratopteris richardii]KAH7373271.1 hypothetical protein KP509_17G047800 [Ceratopteris richardii]KAH7373272.1 hypothetical protein KP509_17G047800 [Ceratopteris richardii]KAH7373273.1 hypothetical protein KP509_17G047800 [Ceratopteris richardii]KAH7373274.1 hypothetical protein KP509_17G047800 [Ceratopteris richardii]